MKKIIEHWELREAKRGNFYEEIAHEPLHVIPCAHASRTLHFPLKTNVCLAEIASPIKP